MSNNVLRNITTAGKGPLETAVVKATWEDNDRPKLKHVQTCKQAVFEALEEQMIKVIIARLQNKSWRVVFKSLLLIHELARESPEKFIIAVSEQKSAVFSASLIHRVAEDQELLEHNKFIRRYAKYLEFKVNVMEEFGFILERRIDGQASDFFNSFDYKKLGKLLPRVMQQCSLLLLCEVYYCSEYVENVHPLARQALLFLFKDSWKIWAGIQMIMMKLLGSFGEMSLDQSRWTLSMAEKFQDMNEKFESWEKIVSREVIPFEQNTKNKMQLNPLPESLLDALKQSIEVREATENIQTETLDLSGLTIEKEKKVEKTAVVNDLLDFGTPVTAASTKVEKSPPSAHQQVEPNGGSSFFDVVDNELANLGKRAPESKSEPTEIEFDPMKFTNQPSKPVAANSKVEDLLNFSTATQQPQQTNDIFSSFSAPPQNNFGFQPQADPFAANPSPFQANPSPFQNPYQPFQQSNTTFQQPFQQSNSPFQQPFGAPQAAQPPTQFDPFAAMNTPSTQNKPKRTFTKSKNPQSAFDDLVKFG